MHNRRVWPNTELDASSQNHDAALHLLQYFLICDHEWNSWLKILKYIYLPGHDDYNY